MYRTFLIFVFVAGSLSPFTSADIFSYRTGEVIPGTEGINPEPGVQLDRLDLGFASLGKIDLTDSSFEQSRLRYANLSESKLTRANLKDADLRWANLDRTTLADADLTGAIVMNARFGDDSMGGLTSGQLYSTASYQEKDLRGIGLGTKDLSRWNLSGQKLDGAYFGQSDLTEANLSGARLVDVYLRGILTEADFSDATVLGTDLHSTTSLGFTAVQLYSTASYQAKNLTGISLGGNDLTGWDFRGQNLTFAAFGRAILTDADLTGADVKRARLSRTTSGGFTKEQLYSTHSYQEKDLHSISLHNNDLSGWNFNGQNLANATFENSVLRDVDFTDANLRNTRFNDAVVAWANFRGATMHNFKGPQFRSTASYQNEDLRGINLEDNDLGRWNFKGQNLANAKLNAANFSEANLKSANLKNASFLNTTNLTNARFDSATVYNQWTVFPEGFNPIDVGITFMTSPVGDFDADDSLNVVDIDLLNSKIQRDSLGYGHWPDDMFDVNSDGNIDRDDLGFWVRDLKQTWFGDANLDGEFNSSDMVAVFQADQYEDDIKGNSSWGSGDWNADGEFTSDDLVVSFQDGGYELGPKAAIANVPEPSSILPLILAMFLLLVSSRHRPIRSDPFG